MKQLFLVQNNNEYEYCHVRSFRTLTNNFIWMQKVILVVVLGLCGTTIFAQSCVTAVEKYAFEKYKGAFDGINFSATHWQQNGDVSNRKEDLKKLAKKLAGKLGVELVLGNKYLDVDYLKDINGNIITDTYLNAGLYYANEQSPYYRQIQINIDYLKKATPEEAISTLAEEVYHSYQENEVRKLLSQEYDRKYDELKRAQALYEQKSDVKNKLKLAVTIDNLKQKVNMIEAWGRDFQSDVYTRIQEHRQFIINKKVLANNKASTPYEKISLTNNVTISNFNDQGYINRLETQYNNLQLEKDAKAFAVIIGKVYKDKSNFQ